MYFFFSELHTKYYLLTGFNVPFKLGILYHFMQICYNIICCMCKQILKPKYHIVDSYIDISQYKKEIKGNLTTK